MTQPVSNTADGNLKVLWVTTIADTSAPTVTELTAGTVIDLSCYLTADGFTPGTDEQVINDDRLCSTQTFEQVGRFMDSLQIAYVYRAQDVAGTDNKAFHTLKRGTAGYVVTRWGQTHSDAVASTDVVDVYPATCGQQRKNPPEANSVLRITQKIFVTGAVQRDVAVVV
jgi:hypothetical protein